MRLIAVSQRVEIIKSRNEHRDSLDQRLALFLANAGCLAVPVPNNLGLNIETWLNKLKPYGVLLSGGNNIGEAPERDFTEGRLLSYARDKKIPLLGICRGMQMMALYAGAGLKAVAGHCASYHEITWDIKAGSALPNMVNSFHAFSVAKCPPDYEVLAKSNFDGEIEAIRHNQLPWLGWMWHPERESMDFNLAYIEIVAGLFSKRKH